MKVIQKMNNIILQTARKFPRWQDGWCEAPQTKQGSSLDEEVQ